MKGGTSSQYEILGARVSIWSDSREFLDHYHLQYAAFEAAPRPLGDTGVRARFLSSGPTLVLNGREIGLPCISHPFEEALSMIWEAVASQISDFYLLHAAVTVRDGSALVISGPPGSGKTTLALALAARGWTLYSDEMAPLHRESGLIHPFPRAIHVREAEGGAQAGGGPGLSKGCIRFPVPAGGLPPASWKALVILEGPHVPHRGLHVLDVIVRDPEGRFYQEAAGLNGVRGELALEKGGYRYYRFTLPKAKGVVERFALLRHRWSREIVQLARLEEGRPPFGKGPRCIRMPMSRAFIRVMAELKGHWGSVRSPAESLAHLIEKTGGIEIFSLQVGPAEETARLLEGAMETGAGEVGQGEMS